MKPKHARLRFVLGSVVIMALAVALMLRSFNDSLVFFYTPTQLQQKRTDSGFDANRELRIGGLVMAGSVKNEPDGGITFTVTDLSHSLHVRYRGLLPSLFREGQGVVADGTLDGDTLNARVILAKHDETYLPREVVEQLKASGRWKGGG
ncbi:MAG: cytochrome c maturation protein CcmE [Rickettsiales bacterium]